jgi:GT2 family glycosyltransferase
MNFTLIICTYMRPHALLKLLHSVDKQTLYPNEIIIIDGSLNSETKNVLNQNPFKNINYFLVSDENRGLTKQRNFGIRKVNKSSQIICFLDDDVVLEKNYFEEILKTYSKYPQALGVGGYINNEDKWYKCPPDYKHTIKNFEFDDWYKKDGSRFILRKRLGLDSNVKPGFLPSFSHGRSIGFLPPSGKIYQVEQLMGGVSSFRKEVFEKIQFSTYFEGYGLYEDADFTLRLSKFGNLFVNTNAKLAHYHDQQGRPNRFSYGKMVVRNGWYVWRVKYPNPSLKSRIKWNSITLLLILIRFTNIFTTLKPRQSFTEFLGRFVGLLSLVFNKPKIK